ncbi:sigma-70 family RNA polymerase sigma factor [Streptomyces sp. NBC_00503]|uniref:sigma-70 family RNA polymerase sigma factor n=1 Tax=Streptomyces sp. NBC_00503 TaxID=2903659 RepID=UPI002E8003CC|nr:sigma-70 family RNA polymerase sigma factor [Streptomyces sp. NBC_00503]WUD86594.1 sigma-70 family RNA polymerase sigma factor [Streptomyces sp. NBC_00503]
MDEHAYGHDELAKRFEKERTHLRAVAYRMLGSLAEAEDAVQETWLRLGRSDSSEIENLAGWLTTVVGRICLDMLRSRTSRREDPLESRPVEPVPGDTDGGLRPTDPEDEALLADSVGAAMLVVLDRLAPAERLAFVLHDLFAVPFEDIALITERTPASARQLASRARRRVRGAETDPRPDLGRRQHIVRAFLRAARAGDFEALLEVLDPDVVARSDMGMAGALSAIHGAALVARQAATFAQFARSMQLAFVNTNMAVISLVNGQTRVMTFTIADTRITEISVLTSPTTVSGLDILVPQDPTP